MPGGGAPQSPIVKLLGSWGHAVYLSSAVSQQGTRGAELPETRRRGGKNGHPFRGEPLIQLPPRQEEEMAMGKMVVSRRDMLKLITSAVLSPAAISAGSNPALAATTAQGSPFDYKRFRGQTIFASWTKHPFTDSITAYFGEFEDLTGIKVEYEVVPEQQQRQKNVIQLSSRSSQIDVWESATGVEKRQFFKAGWYQSIAGFLKDPSLVLPDFDPDDIGKGAWELATQPDGSISGLPLQIPSIILAYRKDLFDAKGLKLESLDDLEHAAKALHDPPRMYGFVNRGLKNANMSTFSTILYNFGASYLDASRKLAMTTPQAVKALDYYARLLRNYGPPGVAGFNWYECQTMFLQGQSAIWIDGNDLLAVADDPQKSKVAGKVGYMIVPKGPGGRFCPISGLLVAINPYSKKKEASFLFNQWAVNKKNQVRALLAGAPVARNSAWTDPEFLGKTTLPKAWIEAVKEAPKAARPYLPEIVPVTQFRDIFGVAITKAIEGDDPEKVLKAAQVEFEPIYADSEK
jgi:multiple sugar transport system substrate-binding protein